MGGHGLNGGPWTAWAFKEAQDGCLIKSILSDSVQTSSLYLDTEFWSDIFSSEQKSWQPLGFGMYTVLLLSFGCSDLECIRGFKNLTRTTTTATKRTIPTSAMVKIIGKLSPLFAVLPLLSKKKRDIFRMHSGHSRCQETSMTMWYLNVL